MAFHWSFAKKQSQQSDESVCSSLQIAGKKWICQGVDCLMEKKKIVLKIYGLVGGKCGC